MALGTLDTDTRRKTFLSISHGKIVHYLSGGNAEYFKNVEGKLLDINILERSFNGRRAPFWYLDIQDGKDIYSISLPYASGTLKSIILALASHKSLSRETNIVIEPYERGNYTKVVVYADGTKLDWVTKELPPLKEVAVGGTTFQDDTDRMNFIRGLASEIKERVGKGRLP